MLALAMFFLRDPTDAQLDAIVRDQRALPFTHSEVGATRRVPLEGPAAGLPSEFAPPGFVVDRHGAALGRGKAVFLRACAALRAFAMFPPAWTRVHLLECEGPLREGSVFVTVIRHCGFYSAMPSKVVYWVEERGRLHHFGWALGTLPGHPQCGEERFWVSWDPESDDVRYEVVAFSRPRDLLVRLGRPYARLLQGRFARDSHANMLREVQ